MLRGCHVWSSPTNRPVPRSPLFDHSAPGPQSAQQQRRRVFNAAILTAITLTSFLLLGYHPFAEDAGIYLGGIRLALNPALYPASRAFVFAHMQLTLFPWFLADAMRLLHLPLLWLLVCTQFILLWLLFYAVRRIAMHCFEDSTAQWAAVALTALCLATPVAGTALTIGDPYLTPRSFAAPFSMLLICAVLERQPRLAAFCVLITLCFHPLMTIYASGFALVLWTVRAHRPRGTIRLCLVAVLLATGITLAQRHVTESPAYIHAALARTYFYLADWQWYELFGLVAPLAIFLWMYSADNEDRTQTAQNRAALTRTALACGLTAIVIGAFFVQPASHSHLLARMQPLRLFHTLYILLFLLLGGTLAEWLSRRMKHPAFVLVPLLCAAACSLFAAERLTFPNSAHLEMPWRAPVNPWEQAFVWARDNTPQDAVFALDRDYINAPHEDAQLFRALAERSMIPDYSKDGGSAAIFPPLAETWQHGIDRTTQLSEISDATRIARLMPAGVTWIILQQSGQHGSALTHLPCPYRNNTVLVCQLPTNY